MGTMEYCRRRRRRDNRHKLLLMLCQLGRSKVEIGRRKKIEGKDVVETIAIVVLTVSLFYSSLTCGYPLLDRFLGPELVVFCRL